MKKISTHAQGFTMIETLVSLLIISLGLLGFALLQVESLKAAKTATERSKAINFASDMMDRLRTNRAETNLNSIDAFDTGGIGGPGAAPLACSDNAATSTASPRVRCTLAQLASHEIWQWRTMIADPKLGFGAGIGEAGVAVTGVAPKDVVITIQWKEKDSNKSYTLNSRIF